MLPQEPSRQVLLADLRGFQVALRPAAHLDLGEPGLLDALARLEDELLEVEKPDTRVRNVNMSRSRSSGSRWPRSTTRSKPDASVGAKRGPTRVQGLCPWSGSRGGEPRAGERASAPLGLRASARAL